MSLEVTILISAFFFQENLVFKLFIYVHAFEIIKHRIHMYIISAILKTLMYLAVLNIL